MLGLGDIVRFIRWNASRCSWVRVDVALVPILTCLVGPVPPAEDARMEEFMLGGLINSTAHRTMARLDARFKMARRTVARSSISELKIACYPRAPRDQRGAGLSSIFRATSWPEGFFTWSPDDEPGTSNRTPCASGRAVPPLTVQVCRRM